MALNFACGSVVKDGAGAHYVVIARNIDPQTRTVVHLHVESLANGQQTDLAIGTVTQLPTGMEVPRGWTTVERYLAKWVPRRSIEAFRFFMDGWPHWSVRFERPYGVLRLTTELDEALRDFKDATGSRATVRRDDLRDPHFPGSLLPFCVICPKKLHRPVNGNRFPIHDDCRKLNTGLNHTRYCGNCGERYTLLEYRSRWGGPVARSWTRQIVCPAGEAVRRRNPW